MKRIISLLLVFIFLLTGCLPQKSITQETAHIVTIVPTPENTLFFQDAEVSLSENESETQTADVSFPNLRDSALLPYVEEAVYNDLVTELGSDSYFVENVQAIYVSKEYLDDLTSNSRKNIYFGYTLEEIEAQFQGEKFVFTLGNDGRTIVQKFEDYDDTYEQVIRNVATGAGIILVCVTVSAVTNGIAPAVSVILAMSAKTGTAVALSSGVLSSVAAGIVTGIETKDLDEMLKSAVLTGSESFKWGAITGTLSGGISGANALYGAARNGLTMNQAAIIQRESKLPLPFIKNFHSVDEYNVYKKANLKIAKVNGNWAYLQAIDWNYVGPDGRTNVERVQAGLTPLDSEGIPYELHHIGQKADSPLAILTQKQHHKNLGILHKNLSNTVSEVDHSYFWTKQRNSFWKSLLDASMKGS